VGLAGRHLLEQSDAGSVLGSFALAWRSASTSTRVDDACSKKGL